MPAEGPGWLSLRLQLQDVADVLHCLLLIRDARREVGRPARTDHQPNRRQPLHDRLVGKDITHIRGDVLAQRQWHAARSE